MVAEETSTAPAGIASTAPSGPSRMASVCAALTTTDTTMSVRSAASAGVAAPCPPAATKRSTVAGLTSPPVTSSPARSSAVAMPKPIEPRPMTATRGEFPTAINRPPGATQAPGSDVEPEMHDIAIGDNIFGAFEPHLAGILGALLAAIGDKIVIGDRFGADEALLEIAMDDARGLR